MPKSASPDRPAARQRLRRLATIVAFAMAAFTSLPGLAQVQPEFESLSGAELSALDAVFALPRPVPVGTSLAAGSTPLPAIDAELSVEAYPLEPMEGPDAPDLGSEDDRPSRDYASFGEDVTAIKWELAAVAGYYTAINAHKLFKDLSGRHFRRRAGLANPQTMSAWTSWLTPIPPMSSANFYTAG